MDEQRWIAQIAKWSRSKQTDQIVKGIGDDCAIFRPRRSGEDLVFTTDLLLEGVHFLPAVSRPEDLGYKTLARGVSDLSAMGAAPRFCLLSLALAPWCDEAWTRRFYQGLLGLARRTGAALIGGDLGHARTFAADIMVCGEVPRGRALRRDGAKPGDRIYVSGRLGGSALGLALRQGPAWKRHARPPVRLALGQELRQHWKATAAMDLSDGLSLDLQRLGKASGVSAEIDTVPVFPGASVEQALHGGEDYELLFTLPPRRCPPARIAGEKVTDIGTIKKGRPGQVLWKGEPLPALGYDHFRTPTYPEKREYS